MAPQTDTKTESLCTLLMIYCIVPLQGNGTERQGVY